MSIYISGREFQLNANPSSGRPVWITVTERIVPSHIGAKWNGYDEDLYEGIYPPPPETEPDGDHDFPRAFVYIHGFDEQVGQVYLDPLLILSGEEQAKMSFNGLMARLSGEVMKRFDPFNDPRRVKIPTNPNIAKYCERVEKGREHPSYWKMMGDK